MMRYSLHLSFSSCPTPPPSALTLGFTQDSVNMPSASTTANRYGETRASQYREINAPLQQLGDDDFLPYFREEGGRLFSSQTDLLYLLPVDNLEQKVRKSRPAHSSLINSCTETRLHALPTALLRRAGLLWTHYILPQQSSRWYSRSGCGNRDGTMVSPEMVTPLKRKYESNLAGSLISPTVSPPRRF